MNNFVKLKDLIGKQFTVQDVRGYKWKMWDATANRMVAQDNYEKGFRKLYQVETDQGLLDISSNQLGNMLEGVSDFGRADLKDRTFTVKSNGKTGMEIRYYINPVYDDAPKTSGYDKFKETGKALKDDDEQPLNDMRDELSELGEIPF